MAQKTCTGVTRMYKYANGQIGLSDFKQPVGMHLKESNRWVKKAQTIPWPEIEKRYAALFTNKKGNVAKPLRLALGACIIQAEYTATRTKKWRCRYRRIRTCSTSAAMPATTMKSQRSIRR